MMRTLVWMAPALLLAVGCGSGETGELAACDGITCGTNAQCVDGGCQCDAGFAIDADGACVVAVSCTDSSCGGHGTCSVKYNAVVCDCDEHRAGATCAECEAGYVLDDGVCVNTRQVACNDEATPANAKATVVDVTIAYDADSGWAEAAACDWACNDSHTLLDGVCVNARQVACNDEATPANATATVVDVTIAYDADAGWAEAAACEWTCDQGYAIVDGACVNTQVVACDNEATPENATGTVVDVIIAYDADSGWAEAAACEWTCNDSHALLDGACVNTQVVACNDETTPVNATATIINVTVAYDADSGWADAAACEWTCDELFFESEGACLPVVPTVASCELVGPASVGGYAQQTFVIEGAVVVADGDADDAVAELCYTNALMTEPVCVVAGYHPSSDVFVAEVVFPRGSYTYLYRFSVDAEQSWVECGVGPDDTPGTAEIVPTDAERFADLRASDSGAVDLPIENALVTVVVPEPPSGTAAFFVQAAQTGPAVYVEVVDAQMSGVSLEQGDRVSFIAKALARRSGALVVSGLEDLRVVDAGDTSDFFQDLSTANDLVSGLDEYESEIVKLQGTLASGFAVEDDHWVADFTTTAGEAIRLRADVELLDDEATAAAAIRDGCPFDLAAVMWRNDGVPQPTVYPAAVGLGFVKSDDGCGQPFQVQSAVAPVNRRVLVTFNAGLGAQSLQNASFVFEPALQVEGFELSADDVKTVVITTAAHQNENYEVTASGVLDSEGGPLLGTGSTARFDGQYATVCGGGSPVIISQIYSSSTKDYALYQHGFVELFNRSDVPIDVSGWSVMYAEASKNDYTVTPLSGVIEPGGYFLVKQRGHENQAGEPLPTPDVDPEAAEPNLPWALMGSGAGKVVLFPNATTSTAYCKTTLQESMLDLVGYGLNANCAVGDYAYGPFGTRAEINTNSMRRQDECAPSVDNQADFGLPRPVSPRNSETPPAPCVCSP